MKFFYSHFDKNNRQNSKRLVHHLKETGNAASNYVLAAPDSIKDKEELALLAHWIGVSHDFGKYTSFFQSYLQDQKDSGELKNHTLVSAVWAMYLLSKKWQGKNIDLNTAILLAFSCIRNHHSDLKNLSSDLTQFMDFLRPELQTIMDVSKRRAIKIMLEKQIPDILSQRQLIEAEWIDNGLDFSSFELFYQQITNSKSEFWTIFQRSYSSFKLLQQQKKVADFQLKNYLLFSALIDADKRDAAQIKKAIERPNIPSDITIKYKEDCDFGVVDPKIARIRERLFRQLNKKAEQIGLDDHIFTLTAPTGSGKTLAAINFALKLRKRIEKEKSFSPRIIYALPFTSIIDQNYQIIDSIMSLLDNYKDNRAAHLLKHHHLAHLKPEDFKYAENYPLDKLMLLVESWEAEIVVTTFVQLFETLIGKKNKQLKRYHNLCGDIILLDEVQNIPIEYWTLTRKVLHHFSRQTDSYFVLMTATQPLIFLRDEAIELVDDSENYFSQLNRVQFEFAHETCQLEELASHLLQMPKNKSIAVVLNTIRSSIELYNNLLDSTMGHLFYLSTNIIPKHRVERIYEIRERLKKKKPVRLISTQVIEAGIDFDFDIVYRDLAPIDSIIQAAGRANRHGNEDKGIVRVISLTDEKNKYYGQWIYGRGHLLVAQDLLKEKTAMCESELFHLVQKNYQRLLNIVDQTSGEEIYEKWLLSGDFAILDNFKLIYNRFYYVDVFIETDKEAEEVWKYYRTHILGEKDISTRRSSYLKIRADFRNYIISIPEKYAKKRFWDYCHGDFNKIGYIPQCEIEYYYDSHTGYIREDESEVMIF